MKKTLETIRHWLWNPYFVSILIVSVIAAGLTFASFNLGWKDAASIICWHSGIFLAGYCSIRSFSTLPFWKFLVYSVATFAFEWFFSFLMKEYVGVPRVSSTWNSFPLYMFFPDAVRMLWTILWLKFLFKFETKQAILIGILLGLLGFSKIPIYR